MGFDLALSFYVCMYVCKYVYVRTSGVARVCAFVHVCRTYVSMTHVRIRICVHGFMCLACVGPAMRATRAHVHTYDVAVRCATVGTTPSLLGHAESACTYVCAYVLLGFTCLACVGLATRATRAYIPHKRFCCTLCYCSTTMTRSAQNC